MKTVKVTIEGSSPLLMNQYNVEAELERQKGTKRVNKIQFLTRLHSIKLVKEVRKQF